jgi:hypothetical protein
MSRIAVLIRDRQGEALRMSIGLTVLSDEVDIFMMERLRKDENTKTHLEAIGDLRLKIYSTVSDSGFEYISPEELADKLLEYDRVIPY